MCWWLCYDRTIEIDFDQSEEFRTCSDFVIDFVLKQRKFKACAAFNQIK